MIEHLELSIDELLLDLENPRLGSTSSQSEALANIVRLNPGHFLNLMGSMRDDGLDPGDSLYVVRSDDGQDFVVLEGNRRLSALMVLNKPDVVAGTDLPEATKKSLVREASGFERSKVEPIRCAFGEKDLIYVDPPYFEKGRMLYYDAYRPDDHAEVAELLSGLEAPKWIVSYDDVEAIRSLYEFAPRLQYTIGYSARRRTRGREVMFFSKGMAVPELVPPLQEASGDRSDTPVATA